MTDHREHALSEILETFWIVGDLRCVLVRDAECLAIQVFIKGEPFVTDRCGPHDAAERAAALMTIFAPIQSDSA
jgi:hypothetical protein